VTGLRHLLLSLAAAGMALLLGMALGAGPVTERAAADRAADSARLRDRVAALEDRAAALSADAAREAKAAAALAAPLTAGRLDGRSVLVVVTPGARKADVRSTDAALEDAGATVTATLTLTGAYVDPAKAQSPLEDLSLRLVPPGVEFADGALPIDRVGTVLARATVQRPEGDDAADSAIDSDAAEVIAGLDELEAVRLDGTPGRRAELAVVVTGPGDAGDSVPALTGLLAALDLGSRGAVLTGPGAGADGLLSDVRQEQRADLDGVSTVDSAGTTLGSAALVLSLAEQVDGRAGDYGLGASARRVLPLDAAG
jgi:hypothetical protein